MEIVFEGTQGGCLCGGPVEIIICIEGDIKRLSLLGKP